MFCNNFVYVYSCEYASYVFHSTPSSLIEYKYFDIPAPLFVVFIFTVIVFDVCVVSVISIAGNTSFDELFIYIAILEPYPKPLLNKFGYMYSVIFLF